MLQNVAIAREKLDQKGMHSVVLLRDCKYEKLKDEIVKICPYFELLGRVITTASSSSSSDQKSKERIDSVVSAPKQSEKR